MERPDCAGRNYRAATQVLPRWRCWRQVRSRWQPM